ncbi:SAM-dependent methyltransferase [Actinokineospora sp. NBRC 105648]|uniref:SAM-dependent methyltransferase n=1 Tax=Actinokineospora sp. NBRC 105648 TaxID=3032206 RepID=UPI0024A16098|nr:SAM-dependent methyltransferase [Actinokineospora sp. NBRC 105648]GLZ37899.1 hypothetical protein Acsp05_15230 [Actinokineospora sp. NBRC 105648]
MPISGDPHAYRLPTIDLERPHTSRISNRLLGGDLHWAIDRHFADRATAILPELPDLLRLNRRFLALAIKFCADRGIEQFLDLGCGTPIRPMTHELVDNVLPTGRCTYVDIDPVAIAHTQLAVEEHGAPNRHDVLHADLRSSSRLWQTITHDDRLINPHQPVAIIFSDVLHFLPPGTNERTLATYTDLMPPGSYLIATHLSTDGVPAEVVNRLLDLRALYGSIGQPVTIRSTSEFTELLSDLQLVAPGVASAARWCVSPGPALASNALDKTWLAAIAHKPCR